MLDLALVTDQENLAEIDDTHFLLPALLERGFTARQVAWDDPMMDWSSVGLCIVRSTWDYHLRLPEFLAWVDNVSAQSRLWNSAPMIRWNTNKTYLYDLELLGVPIIPTVWIPNGADADLRALLQQHNWSSAVLKPVVSANAFATSLVTLETIAADQARLNLLLSSRSMMLQPFLQSVTTSGERSLVFIDGAYSHTTRKRPALGLASQTDAESILMSGEQAETEFAWRALAASGYQPLYARVDIIRDDVDKLRLMELELVEPSLALNMVPQSAQLFADAIVRYYHR